MLAVEVVVDSKLDLSSYNDRVVHKSNFETCVAGRRGY